ncbi:MAG: amidohydrolase family protein [Planctomycetes bacterium]|nr:amidohydrolase family protein [Planctomycetota bacterium]
MMKKFISTLTIAMILLLFASAHAKEYDIVINNGRVMDPETMLDTVRNVGIKDGRIVTITEDEISGEETIDAKGLVVAPGFIDTHTHSSDKYAIKMSMMDGVTTGLDLELGALNIAAWYEREAGKWPMNYGQSVSQELARMVVHDGLKLNDPVDAKDAFPLRAKSREDGVEGWSVTISDLDQINRISQILDENLRQGAIGVGSTIGYASTGISTYEMFEAQRTAKRWGRMTAAHTRLHGWTKPPTEAQMAFAELYTNASLLDASLLICHNNDYGWWEIEEKLQMARDKGMNMWSEYYPYDAGSSSIGSEQLRQIDEMWGVKFIDVMYDPSQDKFLSKEEYQKIAEDDPGRMIIIYNPARKEWMKHWIKVPHMVVGSDSMWQENDHGWDDDPAKFAGHPRTSGAHTIVLRMAREADVPLMFTLSQLSYWSAKHLGDAGVVQMTERGRMQKGMVADIVVFDPKTVKEGSDYKAGMNGLPPIGLPHVIVNGVFVKKDNKATNKFPGQPIRYPEEETGRFVPAEKKQWLKTFTIDSGAVRPRTDN